MITSIPLPKTIQIGTSKTTIPLNNELFTLTNLSIYLNGALGSLDTTITIYDLSGSQLYQFTLDSPAKIVFSLSKFGSVVLQDSSYIYSAIAVTTVVTAQSQQEYDALLNQSSFDILPSWLTGVTQSVPLVDNTTIEINASNQIALKDAPYNLVSGKPFPDVTLNGPDDGGDYGRNTPLTKTAGIQEAITSLGTNGGVVFIDSGTFITNAKFTTVSKTTLQGSGKGVTIIQAGPAMNDRILRNTGGDSYLQIQDLAFDCNGANQTASTTPTISNINYFTIQRVRFINPYDSLFEITGNPSYTLNNHCNIIECDFIGTGQTQSTDLVDIGDGTNINIDRCYFFDAKVSTGDSILSTAVIDDFNITDTTIDGNSNGDCLVLDGIRNGKISAVIKNAYQNGIRHAPWLEATPYSQGWDVDFIGCDVYGCGQYGYYGYKVSATDNTYITLNTRIIGGSFHDNGYTGLDPEYNNGLKIIGVDIYNNSKASAGTYEAISFGAANTSPVSLLNCELTGCRFFDNQSTPTQTKWLLISAITNLKIRGGSIANISTLFSLGGTNTNVTIDDVDGFNPQGFTTSTPSVPASGVAVQNTNFYKVRLTILTASGATAIIKDPNGTSGSSFPLVAGQIVELDIGAYITPTYSTLTWQPYGV